MAPGSRPTRPAAAPAERRPELFGRYLVLPPFSPRPCGHRAPRPPSRPSPGRWRPCGRRSRRCRAEVDAMRAGGGWMAEARAEEVRRIAEEAAEAPTPATTALLPRRPRRQTLLPGGSGPPPEPRGPAPVSARPPARLRGRERRRPRRLPGPPGSTRLLRPRGRREAHVLPATRRLPRGRRHPGARPPAAIRVRPWREAPGRALQAAFPVRAAALREAPARGGPRRSPPTSLPSAAASRCSWWCRWRIASAS